MVQLTLPTRWGSTRSGAPASLIALARLGSFENPNTTRVSLYLLACVVVAVVAVLAYGETRTRDLAADHALIPGGDSKAAKRV